MIVSSCRSSSIMQNLFLGPLSSILWKGEVCDDDDDDDDTIFIHFKMSTSLKKSQTTKEESFLSLLWKDSSKTRLMRTVFENHQKCLRRILKCKQFWLLLFLLLSYQLLQFCCKMEHFMVISNTVNAGGFHHRLLSSFLFHFPTIVYKFFSNPNSSIARRAGLKLWQLVATETCRL